MHKETYFTPETLTTKAAEMLAALPTHRAQVFRPADAALLVLDMQEYFLRADSHACVPSAAAILPGIRALVAAFRSWKRPLIFSRHVNTTENAGMMARWWQELLSADSPFSSITAALDAVDAQVITKSQYDAFLGTGLEARLRAAGVGQVVITGVMTHLCCESTARSAFMRGFEVFFCVDGTATYTERHHLAALLNLAHGFALPVTTSDILAVFEADGEL